MTPDERLSEHVDRFNACVRTGQFGPYAELFAEDGRLKLLGSDQEPPASVYEGHEQIVRACERSLADDTLRIVTVIAASANAATFDYGRGRAPKVIAGQIILKWVDGQVTSMTVTMQ